jgi:hypothetical protein
MNLTFFNLSGFPSPGGRVLAFAMQYQEQSQWCWAATSASVSIYLNTTSKWTQCLIVNNALSQTSCCTQGSSPACNKSWFLDHALQIVGNFGHMAVKRAQLSEVVQEIDSNRPLCLRIGWYDGGGHFVAIYGYSGTVVNVGDPWWGDSAVEFDTFPDTYQTGGKWTHTYWVVP